jgi:8-oxo-dGTP pyrophosphatase MutT (NUDIX family)
MIHFSADFSPRQIHTKWNDIPRSLPLEVQPLIESAWSAARARLGDRLYDGPLARLDSWHIADNQLHLELSRTSYKPFYGTNLTHPELAHKYGVDVLANPLGISALIETSDGHLILGRRGSGVAFHAHRIHPLGGTLEQGGDVFAEIRRELQEEAALAAPDLIDLRCVGLAEDRAIRQPELMFHVKTKRLLAEVNLDLSEHDSIWSVRADEGAVQSAMADRNLTPIAVAALSLWLQAATRR